MMRWLGTVRLVVITSWMLLIAVSGVKAQMQEIRNAQNRLVYRVSEDCEVKSPQNVLIWKIKEDGRVVSSSNMLLMRLKQNGKVVSRRNRLMGRIDSKRGW